MSENKEEIISNYPKELRKLKEALSDNAVWDVLVNNDCIIAGGAVTSVFCNREINDIDVYFRSHEDMLEFIANCEDDLGFDLTFVNMTDKSLLAVGKSDHPIQFIIYDVYTTAEDIFNSFDFTVNMGALECKTGQFLFHKDFFKHNSQRFLAINVNTSYPIVSALRVQKYLDRGYTTSKNEMLKLLLRINQLEINSWEEIKHHVGGMYGLDMDKIFNVEEEFSIEKAIEILQNLDIDGTKAIFGDFSYDKVSILLQERFNPLDISKLIDGEERIFKVVSYDEETDELSSIHYSSFKYPKEGVVNGGEKGIFCKKGSEIVSSNYFVCNDNTIRVLELFLTDKSELTTYMRYKEKTIIGDVLVAGCYTPREFMKTFKFGNKTCYDVILGRDNSEIPF